MLQQRTKIRSEGRISKHIAKHIAKHIGKIEINCYTTNMLYYEYVDTVRDYECDVQGIVNNAVYMNYCECARNSSITKLGHSILSLHEKGEDPVVVKAELNFKYSLKGGDEYRVVTHIEKSGRFKLLFYQKIFVGETCALEAIFTVVVLDKNKKPILIEESVFDRLWQ